MNYYIQDWMANICFSGELFDTFDDAEAFLCEKLNEDYETDRQEYTIMCTNDIPF